MLQGAWGLLLSRYSGEQDVVFGATVSGRPPDMEGAESTIGLFINTLPVRVQVDGDALLVKASRSAGLERIAEELLSGRESHSSP